MILRLLFLFATTVFFTSCFKTDQTALSIRDCTISAHRGGPLEGYPENALETIKNIHQEIPIVMVEIDIRMTKDSILVLLHDETLDRTTTGDGVLKDKEYASISTLFLLDHTGDTTSFNIPTFVRVLDWLKHQENVFLSLDVKDRELFEPVVNLVTDKGLLNRVEVICYTLDATTQVYRINNKVNISSTVRNPFEFDMLLSSEIPTTQISAFTGLNLSRESFYDSLNQAGMVVTLGSLGNLDKQAKSNGDMLYKRWSELGVDRFATDRPIAVSKSLRN
jgi:glycerophosphoryl diester phosphodiesterase